MLPSAGSKDKLRLNLRDRPLYKKIIRLGNHIYTCRVTWKRLYRPGETIFVAKTQISFDTIQALSIQFQKINQWRMQLWKRSFVK